MLLQLGIAYPQDLHGIGHVACTLGGVNYESRGGRGCVKGSTARGATSPLFRHQFHTELSDGDASRAKVYADSCVGEPYVWDAVPSPRHGGDCSGFVSSIICAAKGETIHRLFSTTNWPDVASHLGFSAGLGGGIIPDAERSGVVDRPYPGYRILRGSQHADHVRWIQARLNYAAGNHHPVLDGDKLAVDGKYGQRTFKVVVAFQEAHDEAHDLPGFGPVGPETWRLLNRVR
jgi:hypothetical protein